VVQGREDQPVAQSRGGWRQTWNQKRYIASLQAFQDVGDVGRETSAREGCKGRGDPMVGQKAADIDCVGAGVGRNEDCLIQDAQRPDGHVVGFIYRRADYVKSTHS
jgi:hypothetical protein